MAKLYFRYGAMASAKSALLQMAAFNYEERGMRIVVAKPAVDTKSPRVSSRIGLEREVDWEVHPEDSFIDLFLRDKAANADSLECIIVDEAQFLTARHVDELFVLAVSHDVPVLAYGLRSDFKTVSFDGSRRLFELAHALEEMKTVCSCGRKAVFNARKVGETFVREGSTVAIDGQGVRYESLCGSCYLEKVGPLF